MPPPAEPEKPRNELGQFVGRNPTDMPIEAALLEHATDHPEPKKDDPKKEPLPEPQPAEKPVPAPEHASVWEEFLDAPKKKKDDEDKKPTKVSAPAKPPAATKPTPPVKDIPLTQAEIASAAAEGAARAFRDHGTKAAPTPPADTGPKLPPSEERRAAVLQRMEKIFPENPDYKDLSKRWRESTIRFSKYADDWEKANPGQSFDENAEEHKPFMEKNEVNWDDLDFNDAIADMRAEKRQEEQNKTLNQKLSRFEKAEKLREEAPKIADEQNLAAKWLWGDFGDDFKGVINDQGQIDPKMVQTMSEADPVGFAYRWTAATDLNKEAAEVYKLFNGLVDFNAADPIHGEMDTFIEGMEQRLAAKPRNEKADADGRIFATADEWNKLTAEQRESRWKLSARDVIRHRAKFLKADADAKIKAEEDRLERFAKAKGYTIPDKPASARRPAPEREENPPDETPPDDNEKPNSPSAAPASNLAAGGKRRSDGHPNSANNYLSDI